MAAVSAEGEGNRFIAVAIETSERVQLDDTITEKCKHATFSGTGVHGVVDVVDKPAIYWADPAAPVAKYVQFP